MIVPACAAPFCHFGDPVFRITPGFRCRASNDSGDTQAKFQWRQIAVQPFAEVLQSLDTVLYGLQWFAPEKLNIRFRCRDLFRSIRGTAKVELRMRATFPLSDPGLSS